MNSEHVQKAVYDALVANATLVAAVTGIYADVTQSGTPEDDSEFPYIVFGESVTTPFDTKTNFGAECQVQIDIYSRASNPSEVKSIASLVYGLLHHKSLSITDASHILTTLDSSTTLRDPDGVTKRELMLFTVLYDNIV